MSVPAIDFTGKTLLITGAAGAIGREIAALYLALGGQIVLTDASGDAATALAATLDPAGTRSLALAHDVTRSGEAKVVVERALARFGRIDHLVNCAGLYRPSPVTIMTDEDWRLSLAINLDGVFYACRAAASALAEGGAIVNISSVAGQRGSHSYAHYAAAKGGVLALTRSLAVELAPRIRVNAVSPGPIDSPMAAPLMAVRGPAILAQTPLGRLGTPQEVARSVLFLCSDWASFITGEALQVNGGLYMN